MPDIMPMTSANIPHDQHEEKKFNAWAISAGTKLLYTEKPAMILRPAIPPMTNGATAPAVSGRNETNTIQNFFLKFIVFNYIIFCHKCDIIDSEVRIFKYILPVFMTAVLICAPGSALAEWAIVDKLNLAPFVPLVLDSIMMVATGMYEFFVGNGTGIIYIMVWGFLIFTLAFGIVKMFIPKQIASLFGISDAGGMAQGVDASSLVQDSILKPIVRAIVAATLLLQLRPIYITEWLINPFLQFGAMYTSAITATVNNAGVATPHLECPPDILAKGWVSEDSCKFLIQPVSDLSRANNVAIKRGIELINNGLRRLITPVPHGGEDLLSLVSGILVTMTFFSSNMFMALLIIQAIFLFGMSIALYPFNVLTYVAKPSKQWLDLRPAFTGIITALQKLIITMIACAFILCINLAVIRALFNWNKSTFVVAAGGAASSNVPSVATAPMGFGGHSILWLSAILTFYLMFRIFEMTREQLNAYIGGGMDTLYKQTTKDVETLRKRFAALSKEVGTTLGLLKKK